MPDLVLDCRGLSWADAGRRLTQGFNQLSTGESLRGVLDSYPASLRGWLLEAGMRHRATREQDGTWRLQVRRGLSPAQGTIPGVHHVLADERGNLWTAERGPRVARLDADAGQVAAIATVAKRASHLGLDVDRRRLFVADAEASEVIVLGADDLREEARWSAPGAPQIPLVSPDGIVCLTGAATGTVTIARPGHRGFTAQTVEVGPGPHDPVLGRDGASVFVPCMGGAELVKLRLADGAIAGRCATGAGPSHLACRTQDGRIYAANSWDGTVTCVSEEGEPIASADSGGWAHAIALTPDGRRLWVANFLDDTVSVFDADSLARVAVLETEPYPHGLDVSDDGRFAVVTGFAADHVRIFDAESPRLLARIEIGRGGSHTAFDRGRAYIGCSVADRVAAVDLLAGAALRTISLA